MNIEVLNPFEDTIIVYDQEDVLQQAGIGLDQEGECQITMTFNDGKAVAVEDEHLTMVYPTIEEVRKSEQMQTEIIAYTGRDDINQFDIALKYGKLQYVWPKTRRRSTPNFERHPKGCLSFVLNTD